jgi:HEAT repeat protein
LILQQKNKKIAIIKNMNLSKTILNEDLYLNLALSILREPCDMDVLTDNISRLIMNSDNETIIVRSTNILGWIQTEKSIKKLRENLHHHSPIVREACVFILGQIADKDTAKELVFMLNDENKLVQRMAATVIGWAGGDYYIDMIIENGLMNNPNIHEEIISILHQIASEKANQCLKTLT